MPSDLATIKISKKMLNMIKDVQREEEFPIFSNDSLVIDVAVHNFLNEWYLKESEQTKKNLRLKILGDLEMMKQEGLIGKKIRGYDRK